MRNCNRNNVLSTLTPTYLFVLVRDEYRRPFTYGLLIWASVRPPSLSGHEADSLTCDHLSNRPSYCQNNPYNDETFDEPFHTGDYLFIWCYYCNFTVTSRKALTFLWGLLSSSSVGAGDEDRTRDPLLGKQMLYHWATPAQSQSISEHLIAVRKFR